MTKLDEKHARWLLKLSTFDCDIQYLEGMRNVLADALSRYFKNPEELPEFIRPSSSHQSTTSDKKPPQFNSQNSSINPFAFSEMPSSTSPATVNSAAVTTRSSSKEAAAILEGLKASQWDTPTYGMKSEWDWNHNLDNSHNNCEYNACRGRGLSAGHHPDCPYQEEEYTPEPNEYSARVPANQERLNNNGVPWSQVVITPIKEEEYNTDEAGAEETHSNHGALHWTACYVENCKIHTNKATQVHQTLRIQQQIRAH